jgi:hypothetical protein
VRLPRLFLFCALAAVVLSCGSRDGDPPVSLGVPPAAGKELRIRDITDPASAQKAAHLDFVSVSGVTVIAVDTHDETANGRSRGTVYVQDLGSTEPYSGISLFAPEFVPGNLKVGPGDVLDLRGTFQENQNIGAASFAPGAPLPQLARPIATFRFEDKQPEPIDIDVNDLADYEKGRRWLNMLVRVKDVTVLRDVEQTAERARVSAPLLPGEVGSCEDPFPKPPTLTNELANLNELAIKENTQLKSVVGIVTYFCNLHLSPRSVADVQIN